MRRYLACFTLAFACAFAHAADPRVSLQTSRGEIVLELYPQKAPKTVANFIEYVKAGQYDGTIFHRVIPGFMVQGGGFTPDMQQRQTKDPVENEAGVSSAAGLKNTLGTVAMARTRDPHSASAQFFINVADNAFLDYSAPTTAGYGYTVFGKVVKGMDVVNAIVTVPTGSAGMHANVPREPIMIKSATLLQTQ